ncbi:MAG: tRNA uridine-5-carboxymethylaminomethyl(34) synthesis GTPase MnmE [Clostridia bacterium]|nr:tRNA uridine-5-carboxymethylaminomethyl(34) synthesis GTPase MnmE [Clostridia bacterium]
MDTITGISTPIGSGAISIVRLSGVRAKSIALHFFSSNLFSDIKDIQPNRMYLGVFNGSNFQEKCMCVYFKAPYSYTGEDLVEFQLHGGVRLTNNVLKELLDGGARRATAGEFTRRAFLNGKMTLAEAEGALSLINAESEAELNAGYRMLEGAIGRKLRSLSSRLLEVITVITASLDYPDEMADEVVAAKAPLEEIKKDLDAFYSTAKTGRYIKNGINVAIIGRPNVGKSSLLNALLQEDRAIVTDIAGTTRDTISESLVYEGIRINLLDTAGIRESEDAIESIGIRRAYAAAERADVIIYLMDITEGETAEDKAFIERYAKCKLIKIFNKADLKCGESSVDGLIISALNGEGIPQLLNEIADIASDRRLYGDMLTEERHIDALRRAKERLDTAVENYTAMPEDCILIDLNACYQAILEIDGGTATEQIIDSIFARFCVGK